MGLISGKVWTGDCMSNSYPVQDKQDGGLMRYQSDVLIDAKGRLHPASAKGAGIPYAAPDSYESKIAQLDPKKDRPLKTFRLGDGNQPGDADLTFS
jgi:hypothetical protein